MKAKGIRKLFCTLTHFLCIDNGFSCWFHSHLFSHYLVLRAITSATLDRMGRYVIVFVLSGFYVNSSYNAEINPYFTLTHCPAWHTAVVKRAEWRCVSILFCPMQNLELALCIISAPPFLCVCLLWKTSVKGYKHQLLPKSYSNPGTNTI